MNAHNQAMERIIRTNARIQALEAENEALRIRIAAQPAPKLWMPTGCHQCNGTGLVVHGLGISDCQICKSAPGAQPSVLFLPADDTEGGAL